MRTARQLHERDRGGRERFHPYGSDYWRTREGGVRVEHAHGLSRRGSWHLSAGDVCGGFQVDELLCWGLRAHPEAIQGKRKDRVIGGGGGVLNCCLP